MSRTFLTATGLLLLPIQVSAGGLDRIPLSTSILFQDGRYLELGFGRMMPSVEASIDVVPGMAVDTRGNVLGAFNTPSIAYKTAVTTDLDVAVILNQPIGANLAYPAATAYPIAGTTAAVDTTALTLLGRYRLPRNVSLIGGVSVYNTSGDVSLPVMTAFGQIPYSMGSSTETDLGYILGLAYEREEIGLRVALTYTSEIRHRFSAREAAVDFTGTLRFYNSTFTTTIPQSLALEAQTGIAEDTLLFGSIRWVDWSAFDINPPAYRNANIANPGREKLVGYERDHVTYSLGVGRRFTDAWSGAIMASYEDDSQPEASNLGPTNGYTSLGVGVTYSTGSFDVTGIVSYYDFTDGQTQQINANLRNNYAWAAGLTVGYRF